MCAIWRCVCRELARLAQPTLSRIVTDLLRLRCLRADERFGRLGLGLHVVFYPDCDAAIRGYPRPARLKSRWGFPAIAQRINRNTPPNMVGRRGTTFTRTPISRIRALKLANLHCLHAAASRPALRTSLPRDISTHCKDMVVETRLIDASRRAPLLTRRNPSSSPIGNLLHRSPHHSSTSHIRFMCRRRGGSRRPISGPLPTALLPACIAH